MSGRPDLMHLVKSIEREAAKLSDDERAVIASRVRGVIDSTATQFVEIRDAVNQRGVPPGWRKLSDDEVILDGDKRQDRDDRIGFYRPCLGVVGCSVAAAKAKYQFIDHVIREIKEAQ